MGEGHPTSVVFKTQPGSPNQPQEIINQNCKAIWKNTFANVLRKAMETIANIHLGIN